MDATDVEMLKTQEKKDGKEAKVESRRSIKSLMRRKSWKELSPVQKVGNIVSAIVELTLLTLALWDLAHRPAEEINGKKRTWAMVSFIQPFGPIIYFIFGRKRQHSPQGMQPASAAA